jgi:hypothetical protein
MESHHVHPILEVFADPSYIFAAFRFLARQA